MTSLTDAELLRYSRHLLLPELGIEAQMRWKSSLVSIIGCGGLGHPVALYLASSGVGRIHLVDADVIEASNLQRQISFTTADIAKPKAEVLASVLKALNPHVTISISVESVSEDMSNELGNILAQSHLLFDCTDNFETRYFINRLSLEMGVPLVSAAATGFEGVVGVFNQDNVSPCYACLFSEEDTFEARQTCSEVGVFAPLLGVVGSYQSGLGLRLLAGGVCEGIVAWDLQQMKIRHSSLKKDPTCTVCSVYRANGA